MRNRAGTIPLYRPWIPSSLAIVTKQSEGKSEKEEDEEEEERREGMEGKENE